METQTTSAGQTNRPRLSRPHDDRIVAGVAAGIADHLNINTLWVRIAFIVLTFTGIGAPLYIAGWLLIPDANQSRSAAEKFVSNLDTNDKRIGAALVAVALLLVITPATPFVLGIVGIGAIVYALSNNNEPNQPVNEPINNEPVASGDEEE